MKHQTYFNWSSGKDASMGLYYLQNSGKYEVSLLSTSINEELDRVTMHGLRRSLLERQADSLGIPLRLIKLPLNTDMETYGKLMEKEINHLKENGYTHAAFGDIFLEDLKAYRDKMLAEFNIDGVYPIWKKDTKELALELIELGFKAKLVCINNDLLDDSFLGATIDHEFLDRLPKNVDPCGENGEFHTFCYDGPIFNQPVYFEEGDVVTREYPAPNENGNVTFKFLDLI